MSVGEEETRRERMEEIAKSNAYEALDQGIDRALDYLDNLNDTIIEIFPDCTAEEVYRTQDTFWAIIDRSKILTLR